MKITAQLMALFTFAVLTIAPAVQADEANHHGHYDITCVTRNGRGNAFKATGHSEERRDYHVWRELQAEATEDCRHSGSWVCVEKGCSEVFHHED